MTSYQNWIRKSDYRVCDIEPADARAFVAAHHYAGGSSNTSVYRHGLVRAADDALVGVLLWLPPTKAAAVTVDRERWRQVLSLSRMAVLPGVPKGACSLLLGAGVRRIVAGKRFMSLVTYADRRVGHSGAVYRASGWLEVGEQPATEAWLDPATGRQVSRLATRSRTAAEMVAAGYARAGRHGKVKFVLYPHRDLASSLLRMGVAVDRLTRVMAT